MPFGPYESWDDCIRQNQQADDPEAYCAVIKRAIEGGEFTVTEVSQGKKLLLNVEIFQTGVHVPAEGPVHNWTKAEVEDVVKAFHESVNSPVHLKIGHTSPEFCAMVAEHLGVPIETVRGEGPAGNGMISLGRMVDCRLRDDGVLLADFEAPEQVADLIAKGYTDVSVEMEAGYPGHPWVLSAVALLGAERPAVKGLAGLEEQAVLSERKPIFVARFQAQDGHIVNAPPKELSLEELEEVSSQMEQFIKGKRAAAFLRQAWNQIKDKWAALLGIHPGQQQQEDDMDIKTFAKRMKMQEEATEDQVLARLDQLMEAVAAIAQALGLGGTPEEEMPVPEEMAARIKELQEKAKVSQFSEGQVAQKLQAAEGRIATLERDKRMAQYREMVRPFVAVEGKPDDLASELIELEDKVGKEAVDRQMNRWRATQKYAEQAGVLIRIGTSRGGEGGHPFETEMREWMTKNDKSWLDALAHFREEKPAEFSEYRRDGRESS